MSSYRNYTSWKSSVSTPYRSGSSSAYSSRDDISSTTSRYSSSLATTPASSYRPSFSGGTYRLKRDPPTATSSTYISRYGSSSSSTSLNKADSSSSTTTDYSAGASKTTSTATATSALKRYGAGSATSNIGKYSREPSPAALEHTNRIRSRDPSPITRALRTKSRDPSPIGVRSLRAKSRDPSPLNVRTLRGKSRDPSPALDGKTKIAYSGISSYRLKNPSSASGAASATYGSRYSSSRTSSSTNSASSSGMPDKSISYLSVSDFRSRSLSKAKEMSSRKSVEKEELEQVKENEDVKVTEKDDEQFVTLDVCTRATSPTPPGSAVASTVHRTRRIEIAKTIEKTIKRSTRKLQTFDKEMQSDRLDDSTKYSRFGLGRTGATAAGSCYSPQNERYSPNNLRYSNSPLTLGGNSKSSTTTVTPCTSPIPASQSPLPALRSSKSPLPASQSPLSASQSPLPASQSPLRASPLPSSPLPSSPLPAIVVHQSAEKRQETSTTSSSSSSSSKAALPRSPLPKSKLSPPKANKANSRHSSAENLSASKPPIAAKTDLVTATKSSNSSLLNGKLPNKDFRKSALNVGPTDRPRKSRTPSTGTDSDMNTIDALNGALQAIQRLERSPSACSEISNASGKSTRRGIAESRLKPRSHSSKSLTNGRSPSPLSRHNSGTNLKQKSSTNTTTTSSSSGPESSNETKKIIKKIIKKKTIKDVMAATTTSTSSSDGAAGGQNMRSSSIKTKAKSSNENSLQSEQPPPDRPKQTESSSSSKTTSSQKDPLKRLRKLTNFYASPPSTNNANENQRNLESSESSGDLRQLQSQGISLTQANETIRTEKSPATNSNKRNTSASSDTNEFSQSSSETQSNRKKSTVKTGLKAKSKISKKIATNSSGSSSTTSYCPPDTTTIDNNEFAIMPSELLSETVSAQYTTSTTRSSTEQEDPSWWQDTSRQIDTASALDFNLKDEMRFKVRHFDSGESSWWLKNDEDDTLADDNLKTLNNEEAEEDDEEDATDQLNSLTQTQSAGDVKPNESNGSWWYDEDTTNSGDPNESNATKYTNSNGTANVATAYHHTNGYVNGAATEAETEEQDTSRPFPRSHLTPETDWWLDDDEKATNNNNELNATNSSTADVPKQNGAIQLKICRVESIEGEEQQQLVAEELSNTNAVCEILDSPHSPDEQKSSSNSEDKKWWMSGPTKKLFNIPRADSGEKAWWQDDKKEVRSKKKISKSPSNSSSSHASKQNVNNSNAAECWTTAQQQNEAAFSNQQTDYLAYNGNSKLVPTTPPQNIDSHTELSDSFNFEYSERPPPLGQCSSPVSHEHPPVVAREDLCRSPYDNIPMSAKVQSTNIAAATYSPASPPYEDYAANTYSPASPSPQQQINFYQMPLHQTEEPLAQPYQQRYNGPPTCPPTQQIDLPSYKTDNLFISRHQNIDELLGGGSYRSLSPLYFDINKGSFQTMPPALAARNVFLEEITPDQVRIHDSTAQMPVIQRMERDNWEKNPQTQQQNKSPMRYDQRLIDDASIQVYKDGDFGAYLDLESSLAEQAEEIEGLNSSRKNSLVVRTQLSVRVHAIIEKLLSAEGSDLRRALFSLKQVFQEDKDLVHAFVALGGLNCLVRVGNGADQNYQNYILRALGQVMLYVDGMNGVMKHEPTMQWLYSLIASNFRSVVKTALKLLLVFVEYAESNCHVLVNAIHVVDKQQQTLPWSNLMRLLKDYDNADAELVIYAASLINKTLEGLNDQDSFYDESDLLEQQGMESVIQHYMSKSGTDMDLINQLQLYEAVLKFEDGESDGLRLPDNSLRKTLRFRSSTDSVRKSRRHSTGTSPGNINKVLPTGKGMGMRLTPPVLDEDSSSSTNSAEFSNGGIFGEKKPRDGAGVTPGLSRRRRERAERQRSFLKEQQEAAAAAVNGYKNAMEKREEMGFDFATSTPKQHEKQQHIPEEPMQQQAAIYPTKLPATTTPMTYAYKPFTNQIQEQQIQHEQQQLLLEQQQSSFIEQTSANQSLDEQFNLALDDSIQMMETQTPLPPPPPDLLQEQQSESEQIVIPKPPPPPPLPPFPLFNCYNSPNLMNYSNNPMNLMNNFNNTETTTSTTPETTPTTDVIDYLQISESENENSKLLLQLKRDHTVKDLTQKLSNLPTSPTPIHSTLEEKLQSRIVGDMSGLISKAKEGLAKSKSKGEMSRSSSVDQEIKKPEPKKSENELQWEELVRNMSRPLHLCDLDFTDLNDDEDEKDILAPRGFGRGVPPPPPPMGMGGMILPPPAMPAHLVCPPPPNHPMSMSNISNGSSTNGSLIPPPIFSYSGYGNSSLTNSINSSLNGSINGDSSLNTIKKNKKTVKLFWKEVREDLIPTAVGKTIWDELPAANVDTQKLEHLFESRAKDLMTKKQQELNKNKEVIVLDHKRSNAINIAMTKLPPPRAIKAAILKMDQTVVTREGIDKLLNMLPTDEEKGKIQEAQMANPELPLGSAEQFLLTLSSISELAARLRLWAFRLDFDNCEKEIAEPLMDLKQGIEILKNNRTFKCILSTLLSVGIFLNGAPVKGFQIEYLAKVPEVKDTVHKHSLLHHLCYMVMESGNETTDLYSEIGPITRASKADFSDLAHNLNQLENECKSSWDRLKLIAKHDCPPQLKQKLVDFLADCAERIIILQIVHRRVMNRYRKFLLWLGVPQHSVADSKPNDFSRILSEFALEYRTTRERVQQQMEKKANHRERNKTRGKLIIDVAKFRNREEDTQDQQLKELLGTPSSDTADGTLTWRRRRAEQLRSPINRQSEENFTDGDDEILESLVKTATKAPGTRTTPRERKRTRHADRKSFKRSRTREGFTAERVPSP